jgi:hypothetical protein
VEPLYIARTRLVTNWSKEGLPARGKESHGVVLAGMRDGEDEDDLLPQIFDEGVFGPRWAVLDLRLLGWWWTVVLGCSWAATAGKVQVGFSSLFPFSVFIFCFIIQF